MNTSKAVIVWVVVLLLVIVGLAWLIVLGNQSTGNLAAVGTALNNPDNGANLPPPAVLVEDQFPGEVVYVSSAVLPRGGFVVIHKNDNGQPGYIIGAEYFSSATTTTAGVVSLSEATQEGETYWAVLHGDVAGDRNFSAAIDLPLRAGADQLIMVKFNVTKDLPERKG